MKVYYAHSMGLYNTPQEKRDISTLEMLGFEVVNPNSKEVQAAVDERKAFYESQGKSEKDYYIKAFAEVFNEMIEQCEVFAFKALPDGRIPGGVGLELLYSKAIKYINIGNA